MFTHMNQINSIVVLIRSTHGRGSLRRSWPRTLIAALIFCSVGLLLAPSSSLLAETLTTGVIIIEAETLPTDDTPFNFRQNSGIAPEWFALTDRTFQRFDNVPPGRYTVIQDDAAPSYDLTSLTCDDSDTTGTASTGDLATRTAIVNLDPGETVTCRFTNSRRGRIVIAEETNPISPMPSPAPFPFTFQGDTDINFQLRSGESWSSPDLQAGAYPVRQIAMDAGWILDAIQCDDGGSSQPTTIDLASATATIRLDPGETVTCTFINERPGILFTESYAGIDLTEGSDQTYGESKCYWINLQSRPDATVKLVIDADAQVTVDRSEVLLDATNWNQLEVDGPSTNNRVCVTAVDDVIVDGGDPRCIVGNSDILGQSGDPIQLCADHVGYIEHTVITTDAAYAEPNIPMVHIGPALDSDERTVDVLVNDNDEAAVLIRESEGYSNVDEGSKNIAGYWVSLSSMPQATAIITITTDAQISTDKSVLMFEPTGWMNEQFVRISAVDDNIVEGDHYGYVTHSVSSEDENYNGPDVTFVGNGTYPDSHIIQVQVADDDSAGLAIFPTNLSLLEGATEVYSVTLASPSSQPVLVDMTLIVATEGVSVTYEPAQLRFSEIDWDQPQSVSVTAVEDDLHSGPVNARIGHRTSSNNIPFDGITGPDLNIVIADNDAGSVNIAPGTLSVSEAGITATYSVSLTGPPSEPVSVSTAGDSQLEIDPTFLTFTTTDWSRPQTFKVTAVDDDIADGTMDGGNGTTYQVALITHTVVSGDQDFNGIAVGSVNVRIFDNDSAGLLASTDRIRLAEGESDTAPNSATYAVRLATEPLADVIVDLVGDAQLAISPTTLLFSPANWAANQSVVVSAIDDDIDSAGEDGIDTVEILHLLTSADSVYDGLDAASVTVTIEEDDSAGVVFSKQAVSVSEGGKSDAYRVSLTSEPAATVEVKLLPNSQVIAAPKRLVFTPLTWNRPITVTVQALDDSIDESTSPTVHSGVIDHRVESADVGYDGLSLDAVQALITDNDVTDLLFTTRRLAAAEGGDGSAGTATYGVRLSAAPAKPVNVRIWGDDQVAEILDTSLTFDTDNWDAWQLVLVRVLDDAIVEGPHRSFIYHQYAKEGSPGDRLPTSLVELDIADDDAPSDLHYAAATFAGHSHGRKLLCRQADDHAQRVSRRHGSGSE